MLRSSCAHVRIFRNDVLKWHRKRGASSWLSALPIKSCGFALHKTEFRDAICLRYNWTPERLPTQCACGKSFSITHAMDCHCGGFPTSRHNEIRDITVEMMSQVCHKCHQRTSAAAVKWGDIILCQCQYRRRSKV